MQPPPTEPDSFPRIAPSIPLCVDLDDTLIRSDLLWEALLPLGRHPVLVCHALLALLRHGKCAFKEIVARAIAVDPVSLPYRADVLDFLQEQHSSGRSVILTTATHRLWAQRIADHLGIFTTIFATDRNTNLSGHRKRDALESAYGKHGFDYIGDHAKDMPIFLSARESMLVNPSGALLARASTQANVTRVFRDDNQTVWTVTRALRLHQWAKNALLAVPLLSAHLILNAQAWASFAIAFVGFGMVASATYLINDLVDLSADRVHPHKRQRPLASGRLAIRSGLFLALGLGSLGFGISFWFLPTTFGAYLAAYLAITLAYSIYLKRRLLVDAITLAVLYTLRILAGGAAVGLVVSEWLLMFSLFIFLSLAFLKRIIEIKGAPQEERVLGRGYSAVDLETVRIVGITSGMMAVLVLSLYINSPAVVPLYRSPQILWLLCPLLIHWISRIWFLAARGEVHYDPVVFALLDWRSHVTLGFTLAIGIVAKIGIPFNLSF